MKKCILCGKEHEGGCDKSEWDGILKQKFNVPQTEKEAFARNTQAIADHIDNEALKEIERQHIAKKRGRPRKNEQT